MTTYRFRDTFNLWDFDLVHTKTPEGRLSVTKESFRLKPHVAEWLDQHGYPYTVSSGPAEIIFANPDHAFDFKMRWI